jgi:hypothetical protein
LSDLNIEYSFLLAFLAFAVAVNITRKLDHPNILKMYNLYQDDSYFYIGKMKQAASLQKKRDTRIS